MTKKKLLLLLALLMTAATGAWGMQIYISYPSWPTGTNVNGDGNLVLEMEASDSFENVKAKIEDKSGLNPTYMKLYFNAVEMANDETLYAKGVTSNSVLTLVYTLYSVTMKDGVGCVQSKQTEIRSVADDGIYEIYTLPHTEEDVLTKLTVTALDANDDVIMERTFENIPITRNQVTRYTGSFFGSGGGGSSNDGTFRMTADPDWDAVNGYTF